MLASSNYCVSDQFSDVIGLHSQLKDKLYIYIYIYILKERFIGYHILFTKHKKLFLFSRNGLSSNILIFANSFWRQQKLERLWQQTIYQKTPFDRFYQLTKFHYQSIGQTRSTEKWKRCWHHQVFAFLVNFWTGYDNTAKPKGIIYTLKEHFIDYHMFFTKHKRLFLFWRNRPFNNTLIFADFCWRNQKLEVLWQQNIYQETSFYLSTRALSNLNL